LELTQRTNWERRKGNLARLFKFRESTEFKMRKRERSLLEKKKSIHRALNKRGGGRKEWSGKSCLTRRKKGAKFEKGEILLERIKGKKEV